MNKNGKKSIKYVLQKFVELCLAKSEVYNDYHDFVENTLIIVGS